MRGGDIVLPLKDSTSDMAVIARKGSDLVKQIREKKEASKSRTRYVVWCRLAVCVCV